MRLSNIYIRNQFVCYEFVFFYDELNADCIYFSQIFDFPIFLKKINFFRLVHVIASRAKNKTRSNLKF
jgi:hypothetical protein